MSNHSAANEQLAQAVAQVLWCDGPDTIWEVEWLDDIAQAVRTLRPDLVPQSETT